MRLGVGSYTFGWAVAEGAMDVFALLEFARAEAVSVVQVCDNLPLIKLTVAELERVVGIARDAGITLELGTCGLTPENLAAHLRLAERIGAPLLRVVIDGPGYHPRVEEATRVLQGALGLVRGAGVAVGIENHDRFPARVLAKMIEDVNSSQVGICLDTANSLGAGEGVEHVLDWLAQHTVNLHVKDFQIARVRSLQGFTIEGRPAGQGMLDVPALLARVGAAGRCASAIVELWTPSEENMADTTARELRWAQESLEYLRSQIK